MYKLKEIADKIYYVGVNDRQKALFENMWPLPYGVSYNSYLIVDEKTVLVDTVDVCYSDIFLKKIEDALAGRELDYLIVNHMEPDHAGSIRLLRHRYPGVQIVGNTKTFGMLAGFHGIKEGLYEVKEGDSLNIGSRSLTFYMAPMVHWPEVMVTYDAADKLLFSADAFGTYGALDGGVIDTEMNVERFWEEMIRFCSTHGPVWRENIAKVVGIYDRLSRYEGEEGVVIVYGSMYGNTEQMAEAIASSLADNGVRNIVMHNVSKSPASYILKDIFKYKGLIIGSPTYSNQLFPEVDSLLTKIEMREVKNRYFGYFGSFCWAGAAVKRLCAFGEKMKWQTVGCPVEQKQGLIADKYEDCLALGKAMAEAIKGE